jgi:hypothetical protein
VISYENCFQNSAIHPSVPRRSGQKASTLVILGYVLGGVAAAVMTPSANAASCASPAISVAQPVDGGTLKVSRIAGAHAGLADTWDMRYDAWFCNPNAADYKVSSVKIEHLNGATVTRSLTSIPVSPSTVPAGASNQLVMVRDDTRYTFPLPTSIRLTFTLTNTRGGTLATIAKSYPVAENINPGPLKAYFFPMKQSDLPAGAYWTQGRHAENNNFQRWAYDLGVRKWDGAAWLGNKPGTDGTHKEDSYTFDRPVYAMSDGLVIGCNRGAPDNDPADHVGNVPGGNLLWVRTGNETTLYAHLKQNSIPSSLCPFSDDKEHQVGDPNQNLASNAQYRIRAGQLIGRTGNSGYSRSGGSHIHIHTFMGLPAIWGGSETGIDADARPLEFVNVRVQEATTGNVSSSTWNQITSRKLLPYDTRIEPNGCGYAPSSAAGKAEVVNAAVPGRCFLQMYNAMVQAGDRPVSIDVHGTGASSNSTTVWRPADGTAWALLAGLSDSGLQSARNTWVTGYGYRILQLEAYAEGGVLKHAVIFVKGQPGAAQFAQADMTSATLQSVFNTQTANGFVPVNISGAVVGGVTKFDALFEKKSVGAFIAKAAIPIANYQAEFDAQSAAGRSLAYIDGYELGSEGYVSAIWYGGLTGGYSALHGQTKTQLTTAAAQNLASGYLTRGATEYTHGGVLRYAGFWRPAPNTTITAGPSGSTTSTTAFLSFTSNDPLATFECKLDAGAWATCSSPKTYLGLSYTPHTFYVRARDRQGMRDGSPATRTWTVY